MSGFRIGRLFGIDIVVDWTWLMMVVLIWAGTRSAFDRAYPDEASFAAVAITAGFFGSVLAHELSHSIVARARQLPVKRIRLYIFGGASELGTDTKGPADEFLVTVVGPGSSFLLALLFRLGFLATEGAAAAAFGYLAWLNLALGIFNLVPAFPLDGGRILRSLVWGVTGRRDVATVAAARSGQALAGLLIAGGIVLAFTRDVSALWYALIGWMIGSAATAALRETALQRSLGALLASDVMWHRPLAVHPDEPLARVSWMFPDAPHPAFPVVDAWGRVVGLLTVRHAHEVGGSDLSRSAYTVGQVMEPASHVVHPWTPAQEVLNVIREAGGERVVVVDAWGRLVGMVTAGTLTSRR